MPKLRIIPWLFGVALVLTSLAGANCLMNASDASSSGSAPPALPKPANGSEGLIAKGTVYSDPMTFPVTLPAHLVAGEIAKIHVKSGQTVQANEPLISFDDRNLKSDHQRAQDAYQVAAREFKLAEHRQKSHVFTIDRAKLAHEKARLEHNRAKETYNLQRKDTVKFFEASGNYTPEQIKQFLTDDPKLSALQGLVDLAELQVRNADNDLKQAEEAKDSLREAVEQAAYRANSIKAEMDKADDAVKKCVVMSKMPGMIEQVSAAEGQIVYPQSKPLFYFVPAGPRMVHAEIVPDFAHRIKDRVGKEVQITDDSNTHLVYKGIVKRVPEAFLPKPSGAPDIINGKSNLVLIVEIEVVDAHPKDLPPLRVGQPVRVIFP